MKKMGLTATIISGSIYFRESRKLKEIPNGNYRVEFIERIKGLITPEAIQNEVCEYLKVNIDVMNSRRRKEVETYPRFLSMYFIREYTKLSLKKIGILHGHRDHSSVINGLQFINGQLSIKNKKVTEDVMNLTLILKHIL